MPGTNLSTNVMRWQLENNRGFLVICPPDAGFADFLKRYKLASRKWDLYGKDRIKLHLGYINIDMTNYCRCDPSISELHVHYSYVDDSELREPKYAFESKGKLWTDPQWKILPTRFCDVLARFTELVPRRDMRQNFLVKDLLEHYDDGVLCCVHVFGPWC